jgi:hypothetical protein
MDVIDRIETAVDAFDQRAFCGEDRSLERSQKDRRMIENLPASNDNG